MIKRQARESRQPNDCFLAPAQDYQSHGRDFLFVPLTACLLCSGNDLVLSALFINLSLPAERFFL
ncbi:MAG: hypothetical protein ACQEU7_12120, partial [Bacillota bacterium]